MPVKSGGGGGRRFVPASAAATPGSAAAIYDTIGVATHVRYDNTTYYDLTRLGSYITDLGVTRYRDDISLHHLDVNTHGAFHRGMVNAGIRTCLVSGDPYAGNGLAGPGESAAFVTAVTDPGVFGGAVSMFEGPNERDIAGPGTWVADTKAWMAEFYAAVKGNQSLSSIPFIGPSMAFASGFTDYGTNQGANMDGSTMHPYAGGQYPEQGFLTAWKTAALACVPGEPIIASESGYHGALNTTGGHIPTSETAVGHYIVRHYLWFYLQGIANTYIYQLFDNGPEAGMTDLEKWYGLVGAEGNPASSYTTWTLRKKPAYLSLQRFLARLKDVGSGTAPASFSFSTSGAPGDMHAFAIPRNDGSADIAMWRKASLWNTSTKTDVTVTAQNVTLTLPAAANIDLHRPSVNNTVTSLATNATSTTVSVDGFVSMVRCTPT